MASIKYKTNEGYTSIPMNIIGSRIYLEDYDDGEVIPELVDDNAKLGNGIGTCSTSTGTALEVTLANYKLIKNGIVAVTFEYDVPANATLNINNKGAKAIYNEGSAIEADVIKAGKTVMFAYDGTNYVVTSLGGGGGTIVWPEFVTISLTQSGGSDSDLIGATIIVSDDDTSETILSTTWQGENIPIQIDAGIDYTVTVGNVSSLAIKQNSSSYTAVRGVTRIIEFSYYGTVVDMGLPSGTKWARGNIIPDGNGGYIVGYETDYGAFVSWGNVTPHFSSNGSTWDNNYNWSGYNSTPGASVMSSSYPNTGAVFAANSGYDAARELLGGNWRIPTAVECKELYDNCTSVWTTKNGINGREFTSNINGSKLFIPAGGYGDGGSVYTRGTQGFVLSSSLSSNSYCYFMTTNQTEVNPQYANGRGLGLAVRAVQ